MILQFTVYLVPLISFKSDFTTDSQLLPNFINSVNQQYAYPLKWSHCVHIGSMGNRLKGQCHEMVVEVRPWSGRLGLN
jgi:hypothetical protein